MRIVLAPAGSRGDFQPMLALAVLLRDAGHDPVLLTTPDFVPEAEAFGIQAHGVGLAVRETMRQVGFEASPLKGTAQLFSIGRRTMGDLILKCVPLAAGADLVIGAGAQAGAATIAEAVGARYAFIAYTPQSLRSAHHGPVTLPVTDASQTINRLLWASHLFAIRTALAQPVNRARQVLGLSPIGDWYELLFPRESSLVAADPEIANLPPDMDLAHAPIGSLHLVDRRPLGDGLERFLEAGPPPVYIGFGSMPDREALKTTEALVSGGRAAGSRMVLSSGWAGLGGAELGAGESRTVGDDILLIGPASHTLLFPRVASVVHHGGAGTTAAALRAGRPQVVVPHAFDQFQWGRWVHLAGLGPSPIEKRSLDAQRLASALRDMAHGSYDSAAAEAARSVNARDRAGHAVRVIEALGKPRPVSGPDTTPS